MIDIKKRNKLIFALGLLMICGLLFGSQQVYATTSISATMAYDEIAYETRGIYTSVSLSIKGNGNGTITATARNDFTIGYSVIPVIVELYSSDTYQSSVTEMTLEARNFIEDLDLYKTISVTAKTNGVQRYWVAYMESRLDNADWKSKQTNPVLYSPQGVKI